MSDLPLFNPEADEIDHQDLEAAVNVWDSIVKYAHKEVELAKPTRERNRIWHVTRIDAFGIEWKSTVAARTAEEAIETVRDTDDEFGQPHHKYEAKEGGRRNG